MRQRAKIGLGSLALALVLGACATTGGSTPQEKRRAILDMRNQVLSELYKIHPAAKAEIAAAPGYAVFSNANVNVIFLSFSGGHGVVTDNKTNKNTFMKIGRASCRERVYVLV